MFKRTSGWQKLLELQDEPISNHSNSQKTSAKLQQSEIKPIKNTTLFSTKKTGRIGHNKSTGMAPIYYGPGKKT